LFGLTKTPECPFFKSSSVEPSLMVTIHFPQVKASRKTLLKLDKSCKVTKISAIFKNSLTCSRLALPRKCTHLEILSFLPFFPNLVFETHHQLL